MRINLKYCMNVMAFGSTAGIYFIVILSYLASYFQDFRFCVANNLYGEYWAELFMFLIFGIYSLVILWRNSDE